MDRREFLKGMCVIAVAAGGAAIIGCGRSEEGAQVVTPPALEPSGPVVSEPEPPPQPEATCCVLADFNGRELRLFNGDPLFAFRASGSG